MLTALLWLNGTQKITPKAHQLKSAILVARCRAPLPELTISPVKQQPRMWFVRSPKVGRLGPD